MMCEPNTENGEQAKFNMRDGVNPDNQNTDLPDDLSKSFLYIFLIHLRIPINQFLYKKT